MIKIIFTYLILLNCQYGFSPARLRIAGAVASIYEEMLTMNNVTQLAFDFHISPKSKRCPDCKQFKSVDCFSRNRTTWDGLQGLCKECDRTRRKKWREQNSERAEAYRKEYLSDPVKLEARRKYGREYHHSRSEQAKIADRKYKTTHREVLAERARQRRDLDPQAANERVKEWRRRNPHLVKAQNQKWNRQKPKQRLIINARRRARKLALKGDFTVEEWAILCEHYGNICLRCEVAAPLTVDHIIPVTLVGSTNDISNLQPLCRPCNAAKRNKVIDYRPDKSCLLKRGGNA